MHRARALALAVCLALLAGFVVEEAIVRGDMVTGMDQLVYSYPRLKLIGEALARGEVARWNPYMYFGSPMLGPRAGGVVYPGYLLFAFLPLFVAKGVFIAAHLVLACEGMRRFARLDSPPTAAILCGCLYGLGGWTASMFWGPYLISSALIPWAFLGGGLIPRSPRRGLAIGGSAIGLILLACEPQGALMAAGALGVTAVLRSEPGTRPRAALHACLGIALSAAAAGITVLSILDETPRTDRALETYSQEACPFSFSGTLLDFFVRGGAGDWGLERDAFWAWPLFDGYLSWGRVGQGALAVGLVILALSLGRARSPRGREALGWIGLGVALAASDAGSLLGLRFPVKWVVLSAFGLARLATLGYEAVVCATPGELRRVQRVFAGLSIAFVVAALAVWVARDPFQAGMQEWRRERVTVDGAQAVFGLVFLLGRGALVLGLALALTRARARGQLRRRAYALGLGVLVLIELVASTRTEIPTSDVPFLREPPALVGLVKARKGGPDGAPARLETQSALLDSYEIGDEGLLASERHLLDSVARLRPNAGHLWGVRLTNSMDTIEDAVRTRLTDDRGFRLLNPVQRGVLLDADLFLMNRSDRAYFAPQRDDLQILAEQDAGGRSYLVRNLLNPPYAYRVGEALAVDDVDAGIAALVAPFTPPTRRVVLGPEGADAAREVLGSPGAGDLAVTEFSAERITLRVEGQAPAWLVVRESFSPDWRCTIDGEPAAIARADLLYRAVRVEAGSHEVEFVYDPWWWAPGLGLMALGWLGLLAAGVASLAADESSVDPARDALVAGARDDRA